ncbi:uncharacterized protein LOC141704675 [Apium graveolens]|uniref:uncharacterized protein LOC141704675 n=1 Tax=Apium graveolens TaxID=4045 RepID=UPI003D798521
MNGLGRMGYQYGRVPYNGRREGVPSTDEAPIVVPVASHSATGTFNVNALKKLFNHLEGGRVTATAQAPSPFSAVVREAQLPAGYRNTTNDLHLHGNSDPVEFLGHFNIEMDVYQVPDLARYRLLAATFRESAQQWFQKLGSGVITSWEQMKTLFLNQFQDAKEGESLTSYFKRFNAESTLVRGATDETLKIVLIAGLHVGTDLWKHLQGKDPVLLADVLAQAESFKAIEQSLAETKKNDSTHNSKGRTKRRDRFVSPDYRRNARSPNRVNIVNTQREWSPPSNYEKRVSNYTPLAASIDHIFEVNKERGIFKKLNHLTSWQSRDKKKYCDYHESTGHDTHECHHLKDEIEELIKAGYLGEWIDKV